MMRAVALRTGRDSLLLTADGVAVLLALSLPWSTSGTGLLATLYLFTVLPLIDRAGLRSLRARPAVWLPVALLVFGIVGMAWAGVAWTERFAGLTGFIKLGFIPLLFIHFRLSPRAHWAAYGYLAACSVLLAASLLPIVVPPLRWMWGADYGVPVKNYISQSDEFLIGAFLSLHLVALAWRSGRYRTAFGLGVLACLFFADIAFVRTSRTALVEIPILLALFAVWHLRWTGVLLAALIGAVVASAAWTASPYLRARVMGAVNEVRHYRATDMDTSAGERLEFWKKSLRFVGEAPVVGHGVGSIPTLFRQAAVGTSGASAVVTTNPHNQTFAVAIQLGLLGAGLLWAMWLAQLLMFRPDGIMAWFGMIILAQNIVGSVFNSLIFDFAQGWTYVLGVGAAAGAVWRSQRSAARR